jgi:hypothetical protein
LAILDALGFKARLNAPNRVTDLQTFLGIVEQSVRLYDRQASGDGYDLLRDPGQRLLLFSDTLVFYQETSATIPIYDAIVTAAAFAIFVLTNGLEQGFLLRGAISCGELLVCDRPEAVAGPVVNECAQHYELADWAGCHLTPSAEAVVDQAPSNRAARIARFFTPGIVPIRQASLLSKPRLVIPWAQYQMNNLPDMLDALEDCPLKRRLLAAREREGNLSQATGAYFRELLEAYARDNAQAVQKVQNTLQANGL